MAIKEYKLQEIGKFQNYENVFSKYHVSTDNMEGHKMPNFYPKLGNYFPKNSILMSNIRPYFNKVWYSDREGSKSPNVLCFIVKNKNAISKYIYYLICGFKFNNFWSKTSKGTTMPVGDKNALLNYKFKLPDLDEQQQIINIIEPKEKLFLKYNRVIDISNLDNFKKSWNNLINIIEPFERLKEIFSKKSSLLNEIKDKNKIYKPFKSFKDLIYVESSKGSILKTNSYKNKYRYFNCSSNISFCNTYNKEYDFDSLIITTRGTITSHIVPKNNKFYATNNILIYKGCGINCFDIYFKRNFKKFINGTAIPMITKTDLQEIKFFYLKEDEILLSKINSLDFVYKKLVNKINWIIQLLIELFMI